VGIDEYVHLGGRSWGGLARCHVAGVGVVR
jgi:hypothetical protein